MSVEFLSLADRRLAYQQTSEEKEGDCPSLIFLSGFGSDMNGTKASFLHERARLNHIPFLRFDYEGHGQSSGNFKDGTIGLWLEDTLAILDRLTKGPQILIGSSMGGWLALRVLMERTHRIKSFIGIAAAPDFTEDLFYAHLSGDERARLEQMGELLDPTAPPTEQLPITLKLVREARQHLLLSNPIPFAQKVTLIHGEEDQVVPWTHAQRISRSLVSNDVTLVLIKGGDHRLSKPHELEVIWQMILSHVNG